MAAVVPEHPFHLNCCFDRIELVQQLVLGCKLCVSMNQSRLSPYYDMIPDGSRTEISNKTVVKIMYKAEMLTCLQ